jgi:hypothetical protein
MFNENAVTGDKILAKGTLPMVGFELYGPNLKTLGGILATGY